MITEWSNEQNEISVMITHPEIAKTFNKEITKEKIGNLSQEQ